MRLRYYTNDAGDIMSGVFECRGQVSEAEAPFFDDPDLGMSGGEVVFDRDKDHMEYTLELIDAGLVENDQALTEFLVLRGVLQ